MFIIIHQQCHMSIKQINMDTIRLQINMDIHKNQINTHIPKSPTNILILKSQTKILTLKRTFLTNIHTNRNLIRTRIHRKNQVMIPCMFFFTFYQKPRNISFFFCHRNVVDPFKTNVYYLEKPKIYKEYGAPLFESKQKS